MTKSSYNFLGGGGGGGGGCKSETASSFKLFIIVLPDIFDT